MPRPRRPIGERGGAGIRTGASLRGEASLVHPPSAAPVPSPRRPSRRASWLELHPDPVLVFLHEPPARREGASAALICPPFGWEEVCSYRARRVWADALAQAGHPAARLALPGSGDSAGGPRDPGRRSAWTEAVSGTAAWLRAATGVTRVAAIGIGLGGMLACAAVSDGAPIDDLILWGVPSRGARLLRELRAYAEVVAARRPEDRRAGPEDEDERDYVGFTITAETADSLRALRLSELEVPRAAERRVLLVGRDGLPADKGLREHFERAGAA